ncbi:aminopeptidase Y [Sodiomyces alkalinus F11]|uniref:Peptide hydrolase n=1 Tax=Sodiomyces alkalinus (strain CBS 110278 / VKM F-3762 / F11) TaxID=1314773 RepID=A0A3N2Q0X7_SODAK|nr:aminopeptidase Y [Sodiomyces alkalinus F11]ROT40411.1 aminopeptidase Y [Sodiomyces alkalinus F11]
MKFSQKTAAVLSVASVATASTKCKPKLESEKIQADIKTENLMSHLDALNTIAYEQGNGNRAFGLPGYAASVDYIWSHINNVTATKAWKQDFPAWFGFVESISFQVDDNDYYIYGLTYSPSTPAEGLTAELVLGPPGEAGCYSQNYDGLDVRGKIVLTQRFRCPTGGTLAGRVRPAAENGAAAVIIYHDLTTTPTAGSLGEVDLEGFVPAGFITLADGEALVERIEAGETVEAYFQQTQIVEERITQNVIVETEEGDPHNVIVLGAHLDSVQAGPGINDDGSGTSAILEVFKALQNYRFKNKVRFIWWGAEENGLLGSRYYCTHLEPHEIDDILVYLNFDMVARGYFGVSDNDGRAHGSVAPAGSEIIQDIYHGFFESLGIDVTPAVLTNGSDYASFWQHLNKPFGFLHTGTGVAQDPCYHQECDTIENPNPETLTINAKAAAHQLSILAMKGHELIPKTPVNATMLPLLRSRHVGPELDAIYSLEALGERHLGCGHDL